MRKIQLSIFLVAGVILSACNGGGGGSGSGGGYITPEPDVPTIPQEPDVPKEPDVPEEPDEELFWFNSGLPQLVDKFVFNDDKISTTVHVSSYEPDYTLDLDVIADKDTLESTLSKLVLTGQLKGKIDTTVRAYLEDISKEQMRQYVKDAIGVDADIFEKKLTLYRDIISSSVNIDSEELETKKEEIKEKLLQASLTPGQINSWLYVFDDYNNRLSTATDSIYRTFDAPGWRNDTYSILPTNMGQIGDDSLFVTNSGISYSDVGTLFTASDMQNIFGMTYTVGKGWWCYKSEENGRCNFNGYQEFKDKLTEHINKKLLTSEHRQVLRDYILAHTDDINISSDILSWRQDTHDIKLVVGDAGLRYARFGYLFDDWKNITTYEDAYLQSQYGSTKVNYAHMYTYEFAGNDDDPNLKVDNYEIKQGTFTGKTVATLQVNDNITHLVGNAKLSPILSDEGHFDNRMFLALDFGDDWYNVEIYDWAGLDNKILYQDKVKEGFALTPSKAGTSFEKDGDVLHDYPIYEKGNVSYYADYAVDKDGQIVYDEYNRPIHNMDYIEAAGTYNVYDRVHSITNENFELTGAFGVKYEANKQ